MARRFRDDDDGRPGGGNGKNNGGFGKGALDGSDLGDHLQGTEEDDVIDGMDGRDNINGFAGNDVLIGGEDADNITTGPGADVVALGEHEFAGEDGEENDFFNDCFFGDDADDTVSIGVDDDQPFFDEEAEEDVDNFDLIGGYEGAVFQKGSGWETNDIIELDGLGELLPAQGEEEFEGEAEVGDVVDEVTAQELREFLWVTDDGELVLDADGNNDLGKINLPGDDDVLATILGVTEGEADEENGYDNDPVVEGVTVCFEADRTVVTSVDEEGNITGTANETVEYCFVWDEGVFVDKWVMV